MGEGAHSAEWISDDRIGWWDADFLAWFISRLGGVAPETMLDLGSGAGHWARVVKAACPSVMAMTCVDNDPHWVAELRRIASGQASVIQMQVIASDVGCLPITDNSYDLVTCQTLLMHLADPLATIKEMIRVCRPGGGVLIAEPVNVLSWTDLFTALDELSPNEIADLVRAWTAYHQGVRRATGFDYDIALRLPGLIAAAGINADAVQVMVNPKCFSDDGTGGRVEGYSAEKFAAAQRVGLTEVEWERARAASVKLDERVGRAVWASGGLYLFGFRKPLADAALNGPGFPPSRE